MQQPPSFRRFWLAASISSIGSAVTSVAMPILVVKDLRASPVEVGLVNAAQFVPYAALGLIAGVYTDRWRRGPILVWSSLGRAASLGVIPVLWSVGLLRIWVLICALLLFGAFSVFGFAATQSLLPRLVPQSQLVSANARLDQTDAAAQTLGPALGGGLVGLLGAPWAIAVDAISYLFDAVLSSRIDVEEAPARRPNANLLAESREGLSWMYRHRTLGPLAVSTHVWFLANGAAYTVLSLLTLRSLKFNALSFGLLLGLSGVAGLVGAALATTTARFFGSRRVVVIARAAYPLAWILIAIASPSTVGRTLVFVAMGLLGVIAGIENSNEMGYWQQLTPDDLLGRVNGSRRSVNRTMAAIGALAAGVAMGLIGDRSTLVVAIVIFALAAIALLKNRQAPNGD